MQEMLKMWVWSPGQEDPLEKEMATHSSILAGKIPWTEKPGGLPSVGSQRDTTEHKHTFCFSYFAVIIISIICGVCETIPLKEKVEQSKNKKTHTYFSPVFQIWSVGLILLYIIFLYFLSFLYIFENFSTFRLPIFVHNITIQSQSRVKTVNYT